MKMATKWIWLLLVLFGFFEYAEPAATKWISPISANTDANGPFPPDKLPFAMIKAGVDEIIAAAADENDVMDFLNAESENLCPQGSTPTNTAINGHSTLQMEYLTTNMCAVKLSSVPSTYAANTAGSITDSDSTLPGYVYYMVQTADVQITIPSRDTDIDSEIGAFILTESSATAKEIKTVCNDPNFNGNLRYLYDTKKILLADHVDKRVTANWNDIVCLLKIKRTDDQMEYARATVTLVDENEPTIPRCYLFPTRPDYSDSPEVGKLYYGKQGATCTITSNPEGMFTQTTENSCDTTITLTNGQDIDTNPAPSVTVQVEGGQSGTCTLPVVVLLDPVQCPSNNIVTINATVHRSQFPLEFEDVTLENRLSIHGSDTITYTLSATDQEKFEIETNTEKLKIKGSAIGNLADGSYSVEYVAMQDLISRSVTCTLTITVVSHGTPCEST